MRRSIHELTTTHKLMFLVRGKRTVQNTVVNISSARLKLKAQQFSYRESASSVIFLQQISLPSINLLSCPMVTHCDLCETEN